MRLGGKIDSVWRRGDLLRLVAAFVAVGLPDLASGQTLRGRVVDASTLMPIPAVDLEVVSENDSRVLARAASDSAGSFLMSWRGVERVQLKSQRIGFTSTITTAFAVRQGETVTVRVSMSARAIPVEPLVISSRERSDDVFGNFADFERRKQNNAGHFITRFDIEQQNAIHVADVLRNVPGVILRATDNAYEIQAWSNLGMAAASAGVRGTAVTERMRRRGGGLGTATSGPCPMQLYLDGKIHRLPMAGVNVVPAQQIEGIEVYRSLTEVPSEFAGEHARCGVIAIWTTRR